MVERSHRKGREDLLDSLDGQDPTAPQAQSDPPDPRDSRDPGGSLAPPVLQERRVTGCRSRVRKEKRVYEGPGALLAHLARSDIDLEMMAA